jgi:hypothetical protein
MSEKMFDVYVRYSIKAESETDVYEKWDSGELVFQEITDVIEVL